MNDNIKPELNYIEYHVSYHCNLKCRGCTHFSNVSDKRFGDLEQFKKDLNRLAELFSNIQKIRLLGGEPLLNPDLHNFVTVCRTTFPNADIRVVSNGLLIPRIDKNLLTVMNENNVEFDISQYPPTTDVLGEIKSICEEYKVNCHISSPIKMFFDLRNDKGDSNPKEMFDNCISKSCHFLEDGKISLCPRPIINKQFGSMVGINYDFLESEIIDIYKDIDNGEQLLDMFSKPIESCKYCETINKKLFEWEGNYPYV